MLKSARTKCSGAFNFKFRLTYYFVKLFYAFVAFAHIVGNNKIVGIVFVYSVPFFCRYLNKNTCVR